MREPLALAFLVGMSAGALIMSFLHRKLRAEVDSLLDSWHEQHHIGSPADQPDDAAHRQY